MPLITLQDLIGVWTLEAFYIHRENGELFQWPGVQSGTLIYTASGYVSVAQNRDPLPNPSPEDQLRVANFYTGRYELHPDGDKVTHIGLQSSSPGVIGQRMQRELKRLPDGRLWLSGMGLKERVSLVWRKLEQA